MGSKGNGKHFVGLRFAWHGLESCCCSGVSEPASKGLAPMVSELRPQLVVGCKWTYQRTDHNAFSDNFMPVQIYLHYIYTVYQCADANMYIPIMYLMCLSICA